MKPLSTLTFAAALSTIAPTISATAAIDCGTLPTCEELGYNDIAAQCPRSSSNKPSVIKCPFDKTKGKCIFEAAVGEVAFFARSIEPTTGWIYCNGQTITRNKYPDLYEYLKDRFCNEEHGGSCGTDVARVPDYQGYFFRAAGMSDSMKKEREDPTFGNRKYTLGSGTASTTGLSKPQREVLPDIRGYITTKTSNAGEYPSAMLGDYYGAFNLLSTISPYIAEDFAREGFNRSFSNGSKVQHKDEKKGNIGIRFSAGETFGTGKGIYRDGGHVIPSNYSVNVYIYAGRIVP